MKKGKNNNRLNVKPKWYDLAIEVCSDSEEKIPCITAVPRGEEKSDVHFRTLSRLTRLADLTINKSARFKTQTDFNRAAHYIGTLIIYNMIADDLTGEDRLWGDALLSACRLSERPIMTAILYDRVLDTMDGLMWVFQKGLCSPEELNDRIFNLISQLPENMREPAHKDFKNLKHGKKVSELYLTEHHGGKRS